MDKLLTEAELAELFNISHKNPETIKKYFYRLRKLTNKKHLKAIKIGNDWQYRKSDVEAYLDKNCYELVKLENDTIRKPK